MPELHHIEPFYGWLERYNHEMDPQSPFHDVEHNQFHFDRSVNDIPAHPLWDQIGSESLLVKILFADYEAQYAIIELFGEWNDLFENDFKLLSENCLHLLLASGISQFVLICENVFHGYYETDDYYEALYEEMEGEGWICLMRLRDHIKEDMTHYGIDGYFYWNEVIDQLAWRKLKPDQLYEVIADRIRRTLPG